MQGALTNFIANDELLERLRDNNEYPVIFLKPDLNNETIILPDVIDGERKQVDYRDTPKTGQYRNNLKKVNQWFFRHWADIEIKDYDVAKLASEVTKDPVGCTMHSLRHSIRNRLRAVECPSDVID